MKIVEKITIGTAAAAVGALAAYTFMIAPGHAEKSQKAPFMRKNFAHRGLYNMQKSIPENSLAAFRAAAEAGYGVELDVRITRNGFVVVSHDNNLQRMTGRLCTVERSSLYELQQLRLLGTEESIPLFKDAMDILMGANVPVIVELKSCTKWKLLCEKTLEILDNYSGDYCVESFDPKIVRWFKKNAPDILRGQLTSQAGDLKGFNGWCLSRCLTNFLCRPQFIAHHTGKKSLSVKLCELMGAMKITWTAHSRRWEAQSDAVIFEWFKPPLEF